MNVELIASQVEAFFGGVDAMIVSFRQQTGITCPPSCSLCCEYTRIESTVLEFIPLARALWDNGTAEEVYRALTVDQSQCHFFTGAKPDSKTGGYCSIYPYRGLVCRVFGYSTRREENGMVTLNTCQRLREVFGDIIEQIPAGSLQHMRPLRDSLYRDFSRIAPHWAVVHPINTAVKRAIETVFENGYQPKPTTGLHRAA
jgi:Fe-S-cluster containining protein